MTKATRLQVYSKYDGHCAYCGKAIEYKDMQVDHIRPKRSWNKPHGTNDMKNLNPSCRRCNHYKRADTLEDFREKLKTIHERLRKIYIFNIAEDYGIVKVDPWDGVFYFEKATYTLNEWAAIDGITILDPDGFDRADPQLWERKFTREEYNKGIMLCTIKIEEGE